VVVAAVHARFNLSRAQQTARILKALDNPHVRILAHPSARLIDARAPIEVDMQAVVRRAKARGVALELNAHPDRLDLDDVNARMAKEEGALVAIDSDAHSVLDFENLAFGVGQARRGWLEARDVLNARPLGEIRRFLARAEGAGARRRRRV
jgi:DNA polymerase (family 10)